MHQWLFRRQWLFSVFILSLLLPLCADAALNDINRIYHNLPALQDFEICAGGGCAEVMHVSLSEEEWQSIASLFSNAAPQPDPALEREHLAQALGMFEMIVGAKHGTAMDLAGTFGNSDYPGQMDCNDEAINSTTYMRLLRLQGVLKLHEVEDTRTRNFFFNGWPHSTAVIREIASGERFAVDSWFYDNGFPATIVPFAVWKSGYIPEDSPVLQK